MITKIDNRLVYVFLWLQIYKIVTIYNITMMRLTGPIMIIL